MERRCKIIKSEIKKNVILFCLFHFFFRYSPLTYPPYMKFPVDGIEIAENSYTCNQTKCKIQLGQLRINSTGNFRCEVSGDAPHFKVASKVGHMTVAGECSLLFSIFFFVFQFFVVFVFYSKLLLLLDVFRITLVGPTLMSSYCIV